jgi:predicted Fe-S protein YdhL (DUF1289 family)
MIEKIKSPCTGACELDNANTCKSCFRTLSEIEGWSTTTSQDKIKILTKIKQWVEKHVVT